MEYSFIIYIAFAVIIAGVLSFKADKKLLTFIFAFFILAQPIFQAKYVIAIPGMPFELQANRVLLIILLPFLASGAIQRFKSTRKNKPAFEYFLYFYFVLVLFSLIFNLVVYHRIEAKMLIVTPVEILIFILVYHVLKKEVTIPMAEGILKAIVVLSFITAIVAIYQLLGDSGFMRIIKPRIAFGSFMRSTGIFVQEYDLGYFINFAIILFLVRYRARPMILFVTLPLLIMTLFATFHRLNWIIFLVCLTSYFFVLKKIRLALFSFILLLVLFFIALVPYFAGSDKYTQLANQKEVQTFSKERLFKDTVTGRFEQYKFVIDAMSQNPMGFGGYENEAYLSLLRKHRIDTKESLALTVHNGFLAVGVEYGIMSMIAFSGMMISMFVYFKKRISPNQPATVYPFYAVFIWVLSNFSNSVSEFRAYFVLLVAIISGCSAAFYGEEAENPLANEQEKAFGRGAPYHAKRLSV